MTNKLSDMTITKCTTAEVDEAAAFYDEVVGYLVAHVNYPQWMYKVYPSLPYAREMTNANCLYLCRIKGKLVAAFALNDDPTDEYRKVKFSKSLQRGQYLVIHALAVATQLQGQGIGRQIVNFCIEYAREQGYQAIRLDVVPTNFPAKKLYESCGFSYLGDLDLERGYEHIPLFSMYELNL